MNDAERAHWLEPSPPLPVDGEEPEKPSTPPPPPSQSGRSAPEAADD
jgi:hypothetical protein